MVRVFRQSDHMDRKTEGMTMTTYTGTQTVDNGLYLNAATYTLTTMNAPGALPGNELQKYYRVPMFLMLVAAPLLGLAFVMFLPLLGFAMMLRLLGTKAAVFVGNAVNQSVRVLRPSWAPALAFLVRHKTTTAKTTADNPADAWREKTEQKLSDEQHRER